MTKIETVQGVFPLLWTNDVDGIADWAIIALGLTESWRAADDNGKAEHAELLWPGGLVSINLKRDSMPDTGPSGIGLCLEDSAAVDAVYARAQASGANITPGPEKTMVAYSFTATDADGNQWWVHAETGFLDKLRS